VSNKNSKTEVLLESANSHHDSSISSARRVFTTGEAAQSVFAIIKTRLLDIDEWNKNSFLSSFQLFDENGKSLPDKTILEGVFLRISLKGSGKYDWVKVIEIYEASNELIITVEPTYNPTTEPLDKTVTSHFFTSQATNNFCLLKDADSISLYVIGLVEKQNTQEAKNIFEQARNIATANLGSYLGIQTGEWETFCENFLNSEAFSKND
jgi:hypothetical protein